MTCKEVREAHDTHMMCKWFQCCDLPTLKRVNVPGARKYCTMRSNGKTLSWRYGATRSPIRSSKSIRPSVLRVLRVTIAIERRYDSYLQASLERVCHPPVELLFYCLIGSCFFESMGPRQEYMHTTLPEVVKELFYWQEPASDSVLKTQHFELPWQKLLYFHNWSLITLRWDIQTVCCSFPTSKLLAFLPSLVNLAMFCVSFAAETVTHALHCRWLRSHIFHKLVLTRKRVHLANLAQLVAQWKFHWFMTISSAKYAFFHLEFT